MKKTLLFMLLAVLCTIGIQAQKTVVWEKPSSLSFQTGGGSAFIVTKMELKKNETVMHLNVRFRPHNWIKFVKTSVLKAEDGKEYAIISGEPTAENESRIEPDSLFWMPESGEANLALHFKPLPLSTKKVDFIEGYEEGAFRIWNICEAKNASTLPEGWRNIKYADNETLPEAKVNKGVATLKVWMHDYKPSMSITMIVAGIEPLTKKGELLLTAKMDDNGCAVAEIPLYLPRQVSIWPNELDMPTARCLVAPGETVEYIISPYEKGKERYTFRGYMARTNTDIFKTDAENLNGKIRMTTYYDFINQYIVPETLYDALQKCSSPEERFDALAMLLNKKKAEINGRTDLCDAAKAMMRMETEYYFINCMRQFNGTYATLLVSLHHEADPQTEEEANALMNKYNELMPYETIKDKFCAMSFESFTAPYATCSETFWQCYPSEVKEDSEDVSPNLLENIYGVKQIVKENGHNKEYNRYTRHITDPGCLAALDDYQAEQKRIIDELNAHDNIFYGKLEDAAPEQVLPTILSKYKGKAVLMDIWQTWCGPCRYGHKMLAPVKEELKDKNVAFVYIASPSSPLDTWQKMVNDIPGDHYYLTEEQYNYVMRNVLESTGVPTYVFYDTDGKQTHKEIGFPGADKIKAELEKLMK